jgi:hypothetical protein
VEAQILDNQGNPSIDPNTGKAVPPAKDTVRGGPFVAGAGGGMEYKVSRHFRWTLDTQLLIGFTNVSGVLDLGTGLRYLF